MARNISPQPTAALLFRPPQWLPFFTRYQPIVPSERIEPILIPSCIALKQQLTHALLSLHQPRSPSPRTPRPTLPTAIASIDPSCLSRCLTTSVLPSPSSSSLVSRLSVPRDALRKPEKNEKIHRICRMTQWLTLLPVAGMSTP